MKKFVLLASVSFLFLSLSAQAMLEAESSSEEKKTTPPPKRQKSDKSLEKFSEGENTNNKLIGEFAALLTSFRTPMNGLMELLCNDNKSGRETPSQKEKKKKNPIESPIKSNTISTISAPTNSNIQFTLPEEVLEGFEGDILGYANNIDRMEEALQANAQNLKTYQEALDQLKRFYIDLLSLYGKIKRPEGEKLEDLSPSKGYESDEEIISETTSNGSSSTFLSSQPPLLYNYGLLEELKKKQAAMQQITRNVTRLSVMYEHGLFLPEFSSSEDGLGEQRSTTPPNKRTKVKKRKRFLTRGRSTKAKDPENRN